MLFHPASLLVTAAVLLPNLLLIPLPPRRAAKDGPSADSLPLTIVERAGQVSSFVLPLFFPLSFTGSLAIEGWLVMAVALAVYYAGWIRFFAHARGYQLLFTPMIGVPVPMAVSPVVYFLAASLVLGSVWQAAAAVVLAVGHIGMSVREYRRMTELAGGTAP